MMEEYIIECHCSWGCGTKLQYDIQFGCTTSNTFGFLLNIIFLLIFLQGLSFLRWYGILTVLQLFHTSSFVVPLDNFHSSEMFLFLKNISKRFPFLFVIYLFLLHEQAQSYFSLFFCYLKFRSLFNIFYSIYILPN